MSQVLLAKVNQGLVAILSSLVEVEKEHHSTHLDEAIRLLTDMKNETDKIIKTPTAARHLKLKRRKEATSPIEVDMDSENSPAVTLTDIYNLVRNFYDESINMHQETLDAVDIASTRSYASVASAPHVSKKLANLERNENSVSLFIEKKSGEEQLSGTTIKATLLELPSVKDSRVGISTVVKPSHLIVTARTAEEAALISSELQSGGCKVKNLGKRNPQLKVLNVPSTMTVEVFERSLKQLNPEFNLPEIKTVAQRVNRKNSNCKTMVLRAPLGLANSIGASGGKVYVGHESLPVILDDLVTQCFNCWRLGHTALRCNKESYKGKEDILCPKCGETHPKAGSCKGTTCCLNCKAENSRTRATPGTENHYKTDHSATDFKKCTVIKKMRKNLLRTIYGV